jgi:hypothetical protein
MDCDDVMLVLATREQRTLTGVEETHFRDHIDDCSTCRTLANERPEEDWRWLVRVPAEALDTTELEVLPVVDPVVFVPRGELASGGMGRVTRVFDRRLGREVAVKEILDNNFRARFEREIRITARLQHPAIVSIYEAGTFPDGTTFYTMRLVPGRTLLDAITDAASLRERVHLMTSVRAAADALAYAHAHGVIHRDVKSNNVLVGEFGETVVIDWGLAKDITAPTEPSTTSDRPSMPHLTRHGAVMGTPCFMSPEQARAAPPDASDDVFALGAVMYHVLAGIPPYMDSTAHDADALVGAVLAGPPTPIATLAPDAPADLHAIVERAMSRDKTRRFPTAAELAAELARFEAGQLLASREYSLRELLTRYLRRHRRVAIAAAVAVVSLVLTAIVWLRYQRAASDLALRERGARVTAFYSDVARQAYRIDRDLLRLENALEGLAAAAAWALSIEPIEPGPMYFDTDFADPARKLLDPARPTAYRWPVSVEHPVVKLAPDVDRASVLPMIQRLSPIGNHIRQMVLEAAVGDTTELSLEDASRILYARESPIDYAYVDLPSGVHVVWPGMANLPRDYDVRTASFYRMSVDKRGARWGAPYVDATTDSRGDDLVVPCTKGVWSPTGAFLGVAGVEMTVTKMVKRSMTMTSRTTLRTSLVDRRGRKIIDSGDAGKRFTASGRDEAIELVDFDLPEVVVAIVTGREGIVETTREGVPIVVAFVRLDAIDVIGWYYVVEVEATSLGAR